MIRFCDREVYTLYENEIDKRKLFTYFCKSEHMNDIIVVYDENDNFKGIITYDGLLNDDDDVVQYQKVVINETIWEDAKKIFKDNQSIVYLPVFNQDQELIYFCYNDDESGEHQKIEILLREFALSDNYIFIQDVYKKVRAVYIYDFNEWAWKLYHILVKNDIPIVVIGEKWETIVGIKQLDNDIYPTCSRMNIYAEGTNLTDEHKDRCCEYRFQSVTSNFDFLIKLSLINQYYIENDVKNEFLKKGINMYLCRIPVLGQLQEVTKDEYLRFLFCIWEQKKPTNELEQNLFEDAYGMSFDEYKSKQKQEINEEMTKEYIFIRTSNNFIKGTRYGSGNNRIYLVGPCIVSGRLNLYTDSLPYCINMQLQKQNINDYEIITIVYEEGYFMQYRDIFESLPLKENDMILCISRGGSEYMKMVNQCDHVDIDLLDCFNNRPKNEAWFTNVVMHTTGNANRAISKEIIDYYLYDRIKNLDFTKKLKWLQKGKNTLTSDELKGIHDYITILRKIKFDTRGNEKIGSIVMNCNPLTNGHLYLIEQARKQVDYLYIFVVEEDLSFFKFADRYELVKKCTKEMDNVKVIPSGKFVLSYQTMPTYFTKEEIQNIDIDASFDIEIFAKYIAQTLDITVRFAGTEPFDNITNQYNQEMEETLKLYNIEFIVIQRLKNEDQTISASKVRKLLKNKDFDEIKKYVPSYTFEYLKGLSLNDC